MTKNRLICGDLFGIAERIKSIDDDYQIFFNGETARFELHNSACQPTLQLVIPFDRLDARTIDYAARTRVQNANELLENITRDNEILDKQAGEKLCQDACEKLENLLAKGDVKK
ncbi:MAG: hypothetical protein RSD04_03700 [Clostridia bacterium]